LQQSTHKVCRLDYEACSSQRFCKAVWVYAYQADTRARSNEKVMQKGTAQHQEATSALSKVSMAESNDCVQN